MDSVTSRPRWEGADLWHSCSSGCLWEVLFGTTLVSVCNPGSCLSPALAHLLNHGPAMTYALSLSPAAKSAYWKDDGGSSAFASLAGDAESQPYVSLTMSMDTA